MTRFARYVAVGVVNTLLGWAVIFGCMWGLGWSPEASNVAGYAVGLVISYALNRLYTFESNAPKAGEFGRFLAIFAIAYLANLAVLVLLVRGLGVHEGVSQVVAGVVYVVGSYLLNRSFTFRSPL
jgi:putative flippase GtrA